jgi:hypothetical protein
LKSFIFFSRYPFYGIQFHPEKNIYEWIRNKNITHTANAIRASQYFSEFFVDEARKNDHRFKDAAEEDQYAIYNFQPVFTGLKKSSFEQCYMFDDKVTYNVDENDIGDQGKAASSTIAASSCMITIVLMKMALL